MTDAKKDVNETNKCLYEFAQFRLLPSERLLLREEQPVSLPPKVFDTLLLLVENGGHLIEKDELLKRLWADTFVEEATLARNISILRKTLGETGEERRFIETVPKRGYRFVEPVRRRATIEEEKTIPGTAPTEAPIIIEKPARKYQRTVLWLLLIIGVVGGLFASVSFWTAKEKTPELADIKSIAVLPFQPIGAGERDESLELGMADALITRLAKVRQIVVRPTNTVTKYLETGRDAVQAGRELKVEAVLDGTIQRQGERIRVTARLINAENGAQLWAETFDANFTDIFTVQDTISGQIARSLNLKLSEGEQKAVRHRETENAQAYEFYVKGRYFINKRGPANLQKAIDHFTQAIILDERFVAAYAGLADAYAFQVSHAQISPAENLPKARAAAEKALLLDADSSDAHASLGHILCLLWDWRGAERELKRALELNPNSPMATIWYAIYLSATARHDEAIAVAKRARELDPVSIHINLNIERAYYFARRYDEAIAVNDETLRLHPNANGFNSWREMALAKKGLYDEAMETRFKGMQSIGIEVEKIENYRRIYRERGWRGYWLNEIEEMRARAASNKYVLPYNVARNYARAGDYEQAIAWLEKCVAERSDHLALVKVDPIFEPLHSDPRFISILERVGFD